MKVVPVAAESMGVRSMCTYVEVKGLRILLDPGAALGLRFSLLPHPVEYKALVEAKRRIKEYAQRADVIFISHYHYDHYARLDRTDYVWSWSIPDEDIIIYDDKEVIVKSWRSKINVSQRIRAHRLLRALENFKVKVKIHEADGKVFEYDEVKLRALEPGPHGEDGTALGYVVPLLIETEDERLLFVPDVQGPISDRYRDIIVHIKANIIIIGGPPLYLAGNKVSKDSVQRGLRNLKIIASQYDEVIVDHHMLRDPAWYEVMAELKSINKNVKTMAEYREEENRPLEYLRRELYEKNKPSEDFIRWLNLRREERYRTPPPI
ncbi:MAG: hypothetical protein DRN15_10095 [Thermoprotei archaeon]|nr:MAG: hypothetical protein DRN15_10095 [Thermoprotei archaeon]RLF25531.1 MAG: hypothetical protein DRM97_01475 [Thermoprotei archaeon]